MRQFEVAPGGFTPKHHHPYEHEVFVLEGSGVVVEGDTERVLKAGNLVFVQPNEVHQFRNTGDQPLKFLCLVPNSASAQTQAVKPECSTGAGSRG
jgi:quercetin dioxygenase-like cupin family protein